MNVLLAARVGVVLGLSMAAPGPCVAQSGQGPAGGARGLVFDPGRYETQRIVVDGRTLTVRAFEDLLYVSRPVDPTVQVLNVYVPEEYFLDGAIGGFTAKTAPIFLPNRVGGYMPARPGTLVAPPGPGGDGRPNTIAVALSKGYVVASPGVRGRNSRAPDGRYVGKAPAAIVDLKAAVRYLRHNDALMPGDAEKIVSNGTSAGGALSALLGASGNHPDYERHLDALGAVPGRDDVFAVSAYCPITDLEHADSAYEWQFHGVHTYRRMALTTVDGRVQRREEAGTLTADQAALSTALKHAFPAYVNGLGLRDPQGAPLVLAADGTGSFRNEVASLVVASAQRAVNEGADLSGLPWLTVEGRRVRAIDFEGYLREIGRMKATPAFDAPDLATPENELFGAESDNARHFTPFAAAHSAKGGPAAPPATVRMMNPLAYIGTPQARVARHWRIRHGTRDRDTSLAVPVILATTLRNRGHAVDLALPWDRPHGGDYDLDELFAWMAAVATKD